MRKLSASMTGADVARVHARFNFATAPTRNLGNLRGILRGVISCLHTPAQTKTAMAILFAIHAENQIRHGNHVPRLPVHPDTLTPDDHAFLISWLVDMERFAIAQAEGPTLRKYVRYTTWLGARARPLDSEMVNTDPSPPPSTTRGAAPAIDLPASDPAEYNDDLDDDDIPF